MQLRPLKDRDVGVFAPTVHEQQLMLDWNAFIELTPEQADPLEGSLVANLQCESEDVRVRVSELNAG